MNPKDPTPEPKPMFPVYPGDWPEDFSHENGNYNGFCNECGKLFTGHKRRVVCKLCATPEPVSETAETDANAFDVLRVKGENLHGPCKDGEYVTADFARNLERQCNALRREIEEVRKERDEMSLADSRAIASLIAERDNALAELERVRRSFTMEQFANGELRADLAAAKEENEQLKTANSRLGTIANDQCDKTMLAAQLSAAQARADAGERDTKRLDFLIKNGPPGAAPNDFGLTEEVWGVATGFAHPETVDRKTTDRDAVRAAIDAASEGVGG